MKLAILIAIVVAVLGAISLCEAYPQTVRAQNLLYRRPKPPLRQPLPIRVRRQVLSGQLASNPLGGADAQLNLAQGVGTPDHNLIGSVFAAGNTARGPVTTGGSLAYNNNGLGAAIAQEHVPGVRDTFTKSVSANLFNDGVNSVTANAFQSDNTLANGFKFERNGAGLGYAHADGHALSLSQSRIPDFGNQVQLGGKANLWSSADRNTRVDLTGAASKWTSGPFSGQKDFSGGVGLTHFFG